MQDTGIGRPSTFSSTIETLKKREYIKVEKKSVYVTELGIKLNKLLKEHFTDTFDPKYTALMEEQLDKISAGELSELEFLKTFWKDFEPIVLKAAREINKDKPKAETVEGRICPMCGKQLVYRMSKQGKKFICCSGFPKCHFTASSIEDLNGEKKEEKQLIQCPLCGDGHMVERKNKKGEIFWGCSRYPKCKSTMNQKKMKEYLEKLNQPENKNSDKEFL